MLATGAAAEALDMALAGRITTGADAGALATETTGRGKLGADDGAKTVGTVIEAASTATELGVSAALATLAGSSGGNTTKGGAGSEAGSSAACFI